MRRVSSRQRLVSWDAFDATAPPSDTPSSQDDDDSSLLMNDAPSTISYSSDYEMNFMTPSCSMSSFATLESSANNAMMTTPPATTTEHHVVLHKRKRGGGSRRRHRLLARLRQQEPTVSSPSLSTFMRPSMSHLSLSSTTSYTTSHSTNSSYSSTTSPTASTTTTSRPCLIPARPDEVGGVSSWQSLAEDLQLRVLQFLPLADLGRVARVNRTCRRLVHSPEATVDVWHGLVRQQWPFLAENTQLHARIVSSGGSCPWNVVLSHAPTALPPTAVDDALPEGMQRVEIMDDNNHKAIQLTVPVGQGDRCIRANRPLPRPTPRKSKTTSTSSSSSRHWFHHHHHHGHRSSRRNALSSPPSVLSLVCHRWRHRHYGQKRHEKEKALWRPFCTPRCTSPGQVLLELTLVSYFEISILAPPPVVEETRPRPRFPNVDQQQEATPVPQECVAIGIARHPFQWQSRMPGWDVDSYGYHGDDGGIFHETGHLLKSYGPTFGVGDVVGCGMDYARGTIFFTLNGKDLGDAFEFMNDHDNDDDDPPQPWYPVVGMDTTGCVQCHFGNDNRPFVYDVRQRGQPAPQQHQEQA